MYYSSKTTTKILTILSRCSCSNHDCKWRTVHFQGKQLCYFHFSLPAPLGAILFFKVRLNSDNVLSSREANSKSEKLFPFEMADKHGDLPILLKQNTLLILINAHTLINTSSLFSENVILTGINFCLLSQNNEHFEVGSTFKEKNLLLKEQILSFKS